MLSASAVMRSWMVAGRASREGSARISAISRPPTGPTDVRVGQVDLGSHAPGTVLGPPQVGPRKPALGLVDRAGEEHVVAARHPDPCSGRSRERLGRWRHVWLALRPEGREDEGRAGREVAISVPQAEQAALRRRGVPGEERDQRADLGGVKRPLPRGIPGLVIVLAAWQRGRDGVELHLGVDRPAGGRRHVRPPHLGKTGRRRWMEDAGVRLESVRDDRAYVHREAVPPLANPAGGLDVLARCQVLRTPTFSTHASEGKCKTFARVEEHAQAL